jgi:hypothetical protein
MKSIKKRVEKLERLTGVKKDRVTIFIQYFHDNPPKCEECPEPKDPYWDDKDPAIFPNKDCNCKEYRGK